MSGAVPRRRDAVPERGDWVASFDDKALPGLARGLRVRRVTRKAVSHCAMSPIGWTDMASTRPLEGEGPAKAVVRGVVSPASAQARSQDKRVAEASK